MLLNASQEFSSSDGQKSCSQPNLIYVQLLPFSSCANTGLQLKQLFSFPGIYLFDMFIENNYIPSQPSFVKQFLFLAKVSISLIILENVLCTCSSLNSLNSSFWGMCITRVPTGFHRTFQQFPAQCLVQLPLLSVTCDKIDHSCLPSHQIDALPPST